MAGLGGGGLTQAAVPRDDGDRSEGKGLDVKAGPKLRDRGNQRGLLGGERHAGLPAVQAPDGACDLQHLPDGTSRILDEGDFIGRQHQGFGFQDGLRNARQCERGKKQTQQQRTHVHGPQGSSTIITDFERKFHNR